VKTSSHIRKKGYYNKYARKKVLLTPLKGVVTIKTSIKVDDIYNKYKK